MDINTEFYQQDPIAEIESQGDSRGGTIEEDANFTLALSVLLMCCSALAYQIKERKLFFLPDSAATILVGVAASAVMVLSGHDLNSYLTMVPSLALNALLPLIVFEAGYCFECSEFMHNLFPIILYATLGAMISTFIIGYSVFYFAKWGLISSGVETMNPMEALMFGALISSTDPIATLSIMGNPELNCDETLYSLVFGESVLNDAVSIVLFKTFEFYYHQHITDFGLDDLASVLIKFCIIAVFSMFIGLAMGLFQSYIYKHSNISNYPTMELSVLFLFCYCNYSVAQSLSLSGVMALFINGIIVSHYNSYNLSEDSYTTSEHVFSTASSLAEQLLFLCMGLYTCSGLLKDNWNIKFALWGLVFSFIARGVSVGCLSWVSNLVRTRIRKITGPMQVVLWWAGLRGAIALALSINMPGPNKDTYAAVTLTICLFTTFVCGGLTDTVLGKMGMKQEEQPNDAFPREDTTLMPGVRKTTRFAKSVGMYGLLKMKHSTVRRLDVAVRETAEYAWHNFDETYLRPLFGGDDIRNSRYG